MRKWFQTLKRILTLIFMWTHTAWTLETTFLNLFVIAETIKPEDFNKAAICNSSTKI